jgi:hypothetical protein
MPELDIQTALEWRGRAVVDRAGEKIGTLKEIYLDEDEHPAWGSVHTGLFGMRQALVPLAEARPDGEQLQVPYEAEHVRDAPSVDPDVQLSAEEERLLYRHYRPDAAADAMTRSEEEAHVHTRRRPRERVRLKKYVVTDYVEKKVPVRREELRVEREPADENEGGG